jgi:hypothetical protein
VDAFDSFFRRQVGEPTACRPVPTTVQVRYHGRLPDLLIGLWQTAGWCGYGDGLFWSVDPRDYDDALTSWLTGSNHWDPDNNPRHVIARTAFG